VEQAANQLKLDVTAAAIDYKKERSTFLEKAGKIRSAKTRETYQDALDRFEHWCEVQGILPAAVSDRKVEDFIAFLVSEGRSTGSVRLTISACSSLFTFLVGKYPHLTNPFVGTMGKPKLKRTRRISIPDKWELEGILAELRSSTWVAVLAMAERDCVLVRCLV